MNRVFGNYEVTLRDEPVYSRNSADNPRAYIHEYCRSDEYQHVSAHGVRVRENDEMLASAILLGVGGATGVNENSVAFDGEALYMACGMPPTVLYPQGINANSPPAYASYDVLRMAVPIISSQFCGRLPPDQTSRSSPCHSLVVIV